MDNSQKNPLISVVIPVHNEAKWVADCLRSFYEQTYRNIELVIVDDASEDNSSEEILRVAKNSPFPLKHFRSKTNKGEAASRSKGIDLASGGYIVQTDADALFPKDFIEKSLAYFEKDPDLDGLSLGHLEVHPGMKGLVADYFRIKRQASYRIRSAGGKEEVYTLFMYKRSLPERIGKYDSSFTAGTDMDFGKRARKAGAKVAWAKDVYFEHADPDSLKKFLRRTFNGSFYGMAAYKKWDMWPRGFSAFVFWVRNIFICLSPVYFILCFFNLLWLIPLLLALGSESFGPIILDKETRLMLRLALEKKLYKLALALPMILFLRIRSSNLGRAKGMLFPPRSATTFD